MCPIHFQCVPLLSMPHDAFVLLWQFLRECKSKKTKIKMIATFEGFYLRRNVLHLWHVFVGTYRANFVLFEQATMDL